MTEKQAALGALHGQTNCQTPLKTLDLMLGWWACDVNFCCSCCCCFWLLLLLFAVIVAVCCCCCCRDIGGVTSMTVCDMHVVYYTTLTDKKATFKIHR